MSLLNLSRFSDWFYACVRTVKQNEEHLVDALAHTGDEGRGMLRKATGSCKQADPWMSEWGNPAQ